MRAVQPNWRSVAAGALTVLAALLVLLALNIPIQVVPEEVDRDTFVPLPLESFARLPLEALAFFALMLALPARLGRVRTVLAVVGGTLLALSSIFKILDIGFGQALNRPFDPLIDWTYGREVVELLRDSFGAGPGTVILVVGVAARPRAAGAAAARPAAADPAGRAAPAACMADPRRARVALAGHGAAGRAGRHR